MHNVPGNATGVAPDAAEAVTIAYARHHRPLVQLATLLLQDVETAERVVEDAFVALHRDWRHLGSLDTAGTYLRRSVVTRVRSASRRRRIAGHESQPMQGGAGTEPAVVTPPRHAAVLDALRRLPGRQREALILRYYADLSEAEIAETMRVNRTAVIGHLSGGMAALTQALAQLLEPTS